MATWVRPAPGPEVPVVAQVGPSREAHLSPDVGFVCDFPLQADRALLTPVSLWTRPAGKTVNYDPSCSSYLELAPRLPAPLTGVRLAA